MKRLSTPPLPLALTLCLLGCGGQQSTSSGGNPGGEPGHASSAGANPCGDKRSGGASTFKLPADLSTWKSWTKTAEGLSGKAHGNSYVEIWVTSDHADAYTAMSGDMPVGMVVVKAQHEAEGGAKGAPKNLAVMAKMEKGFAPDRGDWYYGVYSYDGKKVMMEGKGDGKTEMCLTCHDTADTDYLFGLKK